LKEGRRFFQDPRFEPKRHNDDRNVENSLLRRVEGIAPCPDGGKVDAATDDEKVG